MKVARQTGSAIKDVEGWDIDEFLAYAKSVARVLKAERQAQGQRSES